MPFPAFRLAAWLTACWLLAGAALAGAQELQPVPRLTARVTDLTGTLSAEQRARLDARLAAFEGEKGAQIAVLLVATVKPEAIEQYALRVAEAWKLGRKGVDDGALLVVAKDDRALRIEVGYGLEGALNDATAKRIISETIVPRFRDGDFAGGVEAGVDAILRVVGGEPLPPPKVAAGAGGADIESLLAGGFMLVFVIGGVLRAIFGRFLASGIIGAVAGVIAALLFSSLLIAGVVAAVAFVVSLFAGSGVGLPGGGRGGGSWSGGGGFSGGGGGFGGGGASGRW